jgi:hypothetical protein
LPVAAITASNKEAINLIEPTIAVQPGENTIEWNGAGLCQPRSPSLFRYQTPAVGKAFCNAGSMSKIFLFRTEYGPADLNEHLKRQQDAQGSPNCGTKSLGLALTKGSLQVDHA